MRKSLHVSIPFLAAVASACSNPVNVHFNATGQCVNAFGQPVTAQACASHGGYYGGTHYVYTGSGYILVGIF